MSPDNRKPNLTEEEEEAEERDRKILNATRAVSGTDSTPLDLALPGVTEVAELEYWAANGADISARWLGKSAIELAESAGKTQVAELLRQVGGNATQP